MTVSTQIVSHSYYPGGAMAPERIPFQFLDSAHVIVETVDGVQQMAGADYSISGDGRAAQGFVTTLKAYAPDVKLMVRRRTPALQDAVTDPFKPLPAHTLERELDRRALIEQEVADEAGRSFRAPIGETVGAIPPLAQRGGRLALYGFDGEMLAIDTLNVGNPEIVDYGEWGEDGDIIDLGEWG